MSYERIPEYLKQHVPFCCWRYEDKGGAKPAKVPYSPTTGKRAQTNNPATFSGYEEAMAVIDRYDGLGILVSNKASALDLDDCFDSTGNLKRTAAETVNLFEGCYTEYSPSGRGLRILFQAPDLQYDTKQYLINNHKLGLEVYVAGATHRFVTVTGDMYCDGDIPDRTEALQALLDLYMKREQAPSPANHEPSVSFLTDESVLEKAQHAQNAEKFCRLWSGDIAGYGSASEADLALASMLAFWCGRDVEQMDRLFRQSKLYREKWDRVQSGTTYGRITLGKAVEGIDETYSPLGRRSAPSEDFQPSCDLKKMHPQDNQRYSWSDIGNGYLFADYCKCIARFVPERKLWYVFNGTVWQADIGNLATMELCKQLADRLMIYAMSITDERIRTAYLDFVKHWQGRRYRETILKDAASVHPIPMSCFDQDLQILNCLNGTLDLSTDQFRPHNPEDLLSLVAGVHYDAAAHSERWEQFISEVMLGDESKTRFLQKALGYALTGNTQYETLFILYGPKTRNGKGTMMETFLALMGDYGKTARAETIGMKYNNSSNNPSEDIARLAGARFVNISEPDKKLQLSAALVKSLTGNDHINARFLHENSFDFRPQFKLFINTNHLPQVSDQTLFTSGRLQIIPFERHFAENERDSHLKTTLAQSKNLSGILNWCIEGYHRLESEGFTVPEVVKRATAEYEFSSNKIAQFIDNSLKRETYAEVKTMDVYTQYRGWCDENGYKPESMRGFYTAIAGTLPIVQKRPKAGGNATSMITGYRLLSDFDQIG